MHEIDNYSCYSSLIRVLFVDMSLTGLNHGCSWNVFVVTAQLSFALAWSWMKVHLLRYLGSALIHYLTVCPSGTWLVVSVGLLAEDGAEL